MADQKGLSEKKNVSTATLKNKTIAQDTSLNLELLILLPLEQIITLLISSVEAEPKQTHWCIALFSSGECIRGAFVMSSH